MKSHCLRLAALLSLCVVVSSCAEGDPVRDAGPRDATASEDGAVEDGAVDDGSTSDAPLGDSGPPPTTIFQIQDPDAEGHVTAGTSVRIVGVVVAAVDAFEERGVGLGNVSDVWIAEPAGGAFSGLHVHEPTHTPCADRSTLEVGDVVDVEGTIQEYAVPSDTSGRTVTQLSSARVTCTAAGDGTGPAAHVVSDPALLATEEGAEPYEGVLIALEGVDASGEPNAIGTFPLRVGPPVDDDLYAHEATLRDHFVTLRGIFHYMFGRWALSPRTADDVVLGTPRTLEDDLGLWGCADGADGDGDGDIDCADAECTSTIFCTATTVSVQDLQDVSRPAHPAVGTIVALRGPLVVTAIDAFEELPGEAYRGSIVVQDPAATDARNSGVHVFIPSMIEPCGLALAIGDRVYVAGHYDEYAASGDTGGTLTELRTAFVSCAFGDTPLDATLLASPADLSMAATAEPWEGVLVEIRDVTVTIPPGTFGRFQVTGDVAIDDDFHRVVAATGDRFTSLTGIVSYQFEPQLEPRSAADAVRAP